MKVDYDNCRKFINAKEIILGKNIEIGDNTMITGMNKEAERVVLGDNVFIDRNCVVMLPVFEVGDYFKFFKYGRISGYKSCKVGHNFYADSSCILNCTDNLTIKNNVCVGANTALWTHMSFGDVIEGCRFCYTKEMLVEDDVWFNGHCSIAPITAKRKSMAMPGSVVTKDMEENHIYGGVPAVDLTSKLGMQFQETTIEEKMKKMEKKLEEFCMIEPKAREYIKIVPELESNMKDGVSYYNVGGRNYTKRGSEIEIKFMKFLLPLAKFVPV